ncbi:hypothetical protein [Bradyrhizobium sp.]|uniref:hypothetical protein n=1 Tax=Bradyrhizobium sp. TaxID=376 RepID=UPI0039E319B0
MKTLLMMLAMSIAAATAAQAKDALQATRDCMVAHGAVRKPDGSVYLGSVPRAQALAIRDQCRRQSGYKGN